MALSHNSDAPCLRSQALRASIYRVDARIESFQPCAALSYELVAYDSGVAWAKASRLLSRVRRLTVLKWKSLERSTAFIFLRKESPVARGGQNQDGREHQ